MMQGGEDLDGLEKLEEKRWIADARKARITLAACMFGVIVVVILALGILFQWIHVVKV